MATQFILRMKVLTPDGMTEYEVEDVINKIIRSGRRRNVGVNDWIIGTAIATEADRKLPDMILPSNKDTTVNQD